MIFVTVGMHTQPFDRLLREMDRLAEKGKVKEKVFAQTGYSTYKPKQFPSQAFTEAATQSEMFQKARVVVAHAGAGSIIDALAAKKPLVIAPRLARFCEHTNDHQRDLARAIARKGLAQSVEDVAQLASAIQKARAPKGAKRENEKLASRIRAFLEQ